MLTIKLYTAGEDMGLSMAGHAGAGKKGSDIVCAAASILAYTAGAAAQRLHRQGALRAAPAIRLAPGLARVALTPKPGSRKDAQQMLSVIRTGFSLLAVKYPEYVKLEFEDTGKDE